MILLDKIISKRLDSFKSMTYFSSSLEQVNQPEIQRRVKKMAFTIQHVPAEVVSIIDFEATPAEGCYTNKDGDVLILMGPGSALLFRKAEPLRIVL